MKGADVDAALAEQRADAADHTGHVTIVHHQHEPTRNCFNAEIINLGDATLALATAGTEHRSGDGLITGWSRDAGADRRRRIRPPHVCSGNTDASLFSD